MAEKSTRKKSEIKLKELKDILLDDDHKTLSQIRKDLHKLKEQINDRDTLIETLHPVIADSLERKIHESREDMAEALSPIMGEAIRIQVSEAKEDVVDALYPVIGRMIGKAVSEAMKKIVDNINDKINHTLNVSLWFKRIKAKILGVSAAEVLLAESPHFGIRDLFFIEKKSGLLIAHASPESESDHINAKVIGGMLTAIKLFAQDAFKHEKEEELKEITYSDQTIRIDNGKYTYLAAVYSGVAYDDFDSDLRKLHHRMHNRFYRQLRDYEGDNSLFKGVESPMIRFLRSRAGATEATA